MKHASARNVIERAFGIILACCLLHYLINKEMTSGKDLDDVDEGDLTYATTIIGDDIQYIETANEWS